ncbi:MAG: MFS transporter [Armatimonadota bacterium]
MWCPFARLVPPDVRTAYKMDATAGILGSVMTGLTAPFVAVIARKHLHASALEISMLSMAPMAGHLLSLVWANMMEGRRKMPFALWSWVVGRSLLVLCFFATESWRLVAIFSAMYFIASIAQPAYTALMKEIYPDADRARIMGYARVCTVLTYVAVTAIASPIVKGESYRYVFPLAAVFGVASAFRFARIPANKADGVSEVPLHRFVGNGLMILWDDPGFAWFCAGVFVFGFANFLATPIYTVYQVEIGVDTTWAGVYSIIAALTMTASYFYWGPYTDRRSPQVVLAVQTLCYATIPLIYCFATNPWMLLPAMVVSGVVNAGLELSYLTGVLHFAPEDRVTSYQGVFLSLMGVRGMVAPLIGATLQQSGALSARAIFLMSAALMVISVVVQAIGIRRYGSERASARA